MKTMLKKLHYTLLLTLLSFAVLASENLSEAEQKKWLEVAEQEYRGSNYVNAMDAAQKAAEAGYAPAQHFYAFMLWGGSYYEDAFDWYAKAGVQGNHESYYEMAILIINGHVKRGGIQQAMALLAEAGNNGLAKALETLFRINRNGLPDWPTNNNNALRWLTKALQNEQPWAMFTWATILENGDMNQVPSSEQAIHWLTQAGQAGHVAALNKLINVYEEGLLGQVSNKSKVKYWKQIRDDLR